MESYVRAAQRCGPLAGRLLFAPLLITYAGFKAVALAGSVQADMLQHLPLTALLVYSTLLLELVCGVLLIIGYRVRIVAAILIVFFVVLTLLLHPFWEASPGAYAGQLNNFLKNLAFIGGLCYMVAHGAGPYSVDEGIPGRWVPGPARRAK